MKEYLTLFEAYSAVCKKKDELQEAYDAMYRDLQARTEQVRELQERLYNKKEDTPDWVSVSDREPYLEWVYFRKIFGGNEPFEVLVMIDGAELPTVLEYSGEGENGLRFVDEKSGEPYPVTHWMLLPDCPKEAKHE